MGQEIHWPKRRALRQWRRVKVGLLGAGVNGMLDSDTKGKASLDLFEGMLQDQELQVKLAARREALPETEACS